MERDLADPSIRWNVAAIGHQVIGYAKLSWLVAPAPNPQPRAMELRQIYVLSRWHGKGVVDRLITWAVDTARNEGAPEIYLTGRWVTAMGAGHSRTPHATIPSDGSMSSEI